LAKVYPFRGYRYNVAKVKDLNKVVTQPYDRIDPADQERYYQASEYNIVRLILNKGEAGKDRYEAAADYLEKWLAEEVLLQDEEPSFYVYWQEYEVEGIKKVRRGFVGMGKLEGEETVKAHENTLDAPKADRLKLMQATEANFGHIFMLYSDQEQRIISLLDKAIQDREPAVEVNDEDGNIHKLWQISDPAILEAIQEEMDDKILYIADGHHRYQTAVNFRNECLEKGWKSIGAEGFENRLMTFVNIDDPGISILATHRLVYGLADFDLESLLAAAASNFIIKKFNSVAELYQDLDESQDKLHTIGLKAKKDPAYYSLTLKDTSIMEEVLADRSKAWRELDVVILHKLILERYLGIDEKALAENKNIDYIRYRDKALELLEKGEKEYQAAFLLNPTPIEDLKKIADAGERMPQKSTDFYPKLLTGLVLNKLNIEK